MMAWRERSAGRAPMFERRAIITTIATLTLAASLVASNSTAFAFDDAKYPNMSAHWFPVRLGVGGQPAFDPTKAWGRDQQAPLTPEYRAIHEASVAEQERGG